MDDTAFQLELLARLPLAQAVFRLFAYALPEPLLGEVYEAHRGRFYHRVEKRAAMSVALPDEDAELGPIPVSGGGRKPEPELYRLSNILTSFNDQFGTLFTDGDRIIRRIYGDTAPKVAADAAYLNAKTNTPNAARIELDAALMRVIGPLLKDDTEFYKQFVQNDSFKRSVTEAVLNFTRT